METNARHVLIGSFTLLVVVLGVVFAIWLSKAQFEDDFTYYRLSFPAPISGLGKASRVRFNGIDVGEVTDIRIDGERPDRVRVIIRIDSGTPVRTDSIGRVELTGLAGTSIVQISGGSADAPLLRPEPGQNMAKIPARQSTVQQLFDNAPDLMNAVGALVNDARGAFSPANQQAIAGLLANLNTVSGVLADRKQAIGESVDNVREVTGELAELSQRLTQLAARLEGTTDKLNGTIDSANGLLSGDVKDIVSIARDAAANIDRVAGQLDIMLDESGPSVTNFANGGLDQISRFMVEARQLAASLNDLVQKIQSDPPRFLLGTQAKEYKLP